MTGAGRRHRPADTEDDQMGESSATGQDPEGEEPVIEPETGTDNPEEPDPKAPRPPGPGDTPPEGPGPDTIYQG